MMSDLLNRIKLAREGAAVERCHVHPHAQRYSVGHHSLDMVTLIILCWQESHAGELPSSELITAAAFHDIPERVVGDVPQPVKVLMDGALDDAEDNILNWLGVGTQAFDLLTDEETAWLAACDRIELYLWCLEEASMRGQAYFWQWVKDYDAFFEANPPPEPLARVMREAKTHAGERLAFPLLKDIAGL
jgi:5'-deoxynucleotidase YfbR-like HD superfamily hydrolase